MNPARLPNGAAVLGLHQLRPAPGWLRCALRVRLPPPSTLTHLPILWDSAHLSVTLLLQTCGYLVVAYLLSRTWLFLPFMHVTVRWPHRMACYVVFTLFCIMGTYLGLRIEHSIANTRAIGAVLGGTFGGPVVGLAVGLTGGLHRYTLGGPTAFACMLATIADGLLGGLYHLWMIRRGRAASLFRPPAVALVTATGIVLEMGLLLALAVPPDAALRLVQQIAGPMLIANTTGAALFMSMLLDRRLSLERQSSVFSAKALEIAARAEGALRGGLDAESAMRVARIVYEETGVGAVASPTGSGCWPLSALATTTTCPARASCPTRRWRPSRRTW